MWSAANFGLIGGLALAVYVRFRSARLAREAFNAAEMERVGASREVLASRLAAMQARVEPGFLLGTLAQVEALYERDSQAGDRMLDGLITYLHAALPQLRSQRSTLKRRCNSPKATFASCRFEWAAGSTPDRCGPDLGDCDFPPMMLLPLIEDALRNGIEPLPHGGTIAITADVTAIAFAFESTTMDCRGRQPRTTARDIHAQERLRGLYGTTARLEVTANALQGVIATIEVPLETTRDHR